MHTIIIAGLLWIQQDRFAVAKPGAGGALKPLPGRCEREDALCIHNGHSLNWAGSNWSHEAHLHWQKPKSKKPGFFVVPFTLPEKPINIRGFWHEKRMREKTRISYLCFGKWCACATSLYLWPYTCSAHYVAGRGRVIPLKVTYHVTKNPNNTGEIGASIYIGKKPVKFRRSFKKSRCGGGFFDSGFLECLGEVA